MEYPTLKQAMEKTARGQMLAKLLNVLKTPGAGGFNPGKYRGLTDGIKHPYGYNGYHTYDLSAGVPASIMKGRAPVGNDDRWGLAFNHLMGRGGKGFSPQQLKQRAMSRGVSGDDDYVRSLVNVPHARQQLAQSIRNFRSSMDAGDLPLLRNAMRQFNHAPVAPRVINISAPQAPSFLGRWGRSLAGLGAVGGTAGLGVGLSEVFRDTGNGGAPPAAAPPTPINSSEGMMEVGDKLSEGIRGFFQRHSAPE